VKLLNLNTRVG